MNHNDTSLRRCAVEELPDKSRIKGLRVIDKQDRAARQRCGCVDELLDRQGRVDQPQYFPSLSMIYMGNLIHRDGLSTPALSREHGVIHQLKLFANKIDLRQE